MVEYERLSDGGIKIIQHTMRPCVYLDHWAWRVFADDETVGERLVNAIRARKGTLAVSWLNVLEFLEVDVTQQDRASRLAEKLFPQIIFVRLNPFEIQTLERGNNYNGDAYLDAEYGKALVNSGSTEKQPLSIKSIFLNSTKNTEVNKKELSSVIVRNVKKMRDQTKNDISFNSNLRREFKLYPNLAKTILIQREYLRSLLIDPSRTFTDNDAIDMMHTVVPLAYCDYALLDKAGVDHKNRVEQRIKKSGNKFLIAKAYSKSQIEEFLADLESPTSRTVEPIIYRPLIPSFLRKKESGV